MSEAEISLLKEQNKLLKDLLRATVESMPRHTEDCGVHNAHPSYGNQYCTCHLQKFREAMREQLST